MVQIFYTSNVHHFLAALAFTYKASWLHHIQVWCWTVWQYTSFCAPDGTTGDTQAPDKEADSHAPALDSRLQAQSFSTKAKPHSTSDFSIIGVWCNRSTGPVREPRAPDRESVYMGHSEYKA